MNTVKKLNVGIVGYGWAAEAHIAAIERVEEMPHTALADAARTREIIFAADKSAATGKPVKL